LSWPTEFLVDHSNAVNPERLEVSELRRPVNCIVIGCRSRCIAGIQVEMFRRRNWKAEVIRFFWAQQKRIK